MSAPRVRTSVRAALPAWAVTHVGIWLTAVIVGLLVDHRVVARLDPSVPDALRMLGGWDASWYMDIARHGYSLDPSGAEGYTNVAFFPLFPLTIRALMGVGASPFIAAMAVSTVMSLVALAAVHMLTHMRFDERFAHRTVWVFALFAPGITFGLGYSEAIAVACVAVAGVLALKGRYPSAGVVAALATLNRPTGLLVAALVAALAALSSSGRRRITSVAMAVIPSGLALGGFLWWMQRAHGNWRAPLDAQSAWHRGVGTPFLFDFQQPTRVDELIRDLLFGTVAIVLVIALARWRPARTWAPWWGYSAACIAMPLTTGSVYSLARFSLVAVPIAWPLTRWTYATRRRLVTMTAIATVLCLALVVELAWHSP